MVRIDLLTAAGGTPSLRANKSFGHTIFVAKTGTRLDVEIAC